MKVLYIPNVQALGDAISHVPAMRELHNVHDFKIHLLVHPDFYPKTVFKMPFITKLIEHKCAERITLWPQFKLKEVLLQIAKQYGLHALCAAAPKVDPSTRTKIKIIGGTTCNEFYHQLSRTELHMQRVGLETTLQNTHYQIKVNENPILNINRPTVGVCIGSHMPTRRFHHIHLQKVINELYKHYDIFLFGIHAICDVKCSYDNCQNLIGKIDLDTTVQMMNQMNVIVTHDCGLFHVACALRKPIVLILSHTPLRILVPKIHQQHIIPLQQNCAFNKYNPHFGPCQRLTEKWRKNGFPVKTNKQTCSHDHLQCSQVHPKNIKHAVNQLFIKYNDSQH